MAWVSGPIGYHERSVTGAMRATALAAGVLAGCICLGCYTYVPAAQQDITPGASVRVRLSAAQMDALRDVLTSDSRDVDGTVVSHNRDSLVMLVPVVTTVEGASVRTLHQRLALGPGDVLSVDRKQLDGVRTALVAGAAVAGLTFMVVQIFGATERGQALPPATGTSQARVPVWRITLPLRLP